MKEMTLESWNGFRPIALLTSLPSDLATLPGLQFRESHDDLDWLQESAFSSPEGTVFGLISHRGAPVPGTELLAHDDDLRRGAANLVNEALRTLGLNKDSVRWSLPDYAFSRRVFISWSSEEFRPEERTELIRELSERGFEPIPTETPEITTKTIEDVRAIISHCKYVFVLGSSTPITSYELGIASALQKPTWLIWRDAFMRLHQDDRLTDIFTKPRKKSNNLVAELVRSLQDADREAA